MGIDLGLRPLSGVIHEQQSVTSHVQASNHVAFSSWLIPGLFIRPARHLAHLSVIILTAVFFSLAGHVFAFIW